MLPYVIACISIFLVILIVFIVCGVKSIANMVSDSCTSKNIELEDLSEKEITKQIIEEKLEL